MFQFILNMLSGVKKLGGVLSGVKVLSGLLSEVLIGVKVLSSAEIFNILVMANNSMCSITANKTLTQNR